MSIKIGINGFGRMGRLTMRALYEAGFVNDAISICHINDSSRRC